MPAVIGMGERRSDALGVHPDIAQQEEETARKLGCHGTRFDRQTGEAIFDNRAERTKYAKAIGAVDYEGVHGDPI